MPQMSPLMWLFLFIFFSFIYLLSFVKTYFSSPSNISSENKLNLSNVYSKKMNWKW